MPGEGEAATQATNWKGIPGFFRRVIDIVMQEQILGFAQMVAYNVLFATAPLLMVVTAGAATITQVVNSELENPAQPVLDWVQETLPREAAAFLQTPIERAVNADTSWFFSVGAIFALWGARGAVAALIRGLNVAYGIGRDPRPFLVHTARSFGLTLLLVFLVAAGGIVFTLGTDFGERVANEVGLGDLWTNVYTWARWPIMGVISVMVVMLVHLYGPAVKAPFKWYLPGSAFSVIGMYITTVALGIWFGQSQGFSEAYGVFGSVLAFVLWLYLMAFVLLLGGVINAVLQRRFLDETRLRT